MVMPSNNIGIVRNDGNRVSPPRAETAVLPSDAVAQADARINAGAFDQVRLDAIRREQENNEELENGINNRVEERDHQEMIREAYDPWVSLNDAAAAENMVLMFTQAARTPSGGLDSFYIARRNTNDNEIEEVDNPNSTPVLQDSTLEANNQEKTARYQQMIQNQVVNPTGETPEMDNDNRERFERIRSLYNNSRTVGRLFDRRA